jgi:predicted RNA-binding protein YlxR (DUF448 family)
MFPTSRSDPAGPDLPDPGDGDEEETAWRTCVVARHVREKDHLLRFVVDPMGRVVEDLAARLPGRAVYVEPSREQVVALLRRRGLLKRLQGGSAADRKSTGPDGAGTPLVLPAEQELCDRLARGLLQRLLDGLGLARRARCALPGVEDLHRFLMQGGEPGLALMASDTADHSREKILRLLRRQVQTGHVFTALDRNMLGAALGTGLVAVVTITGVVFTRRVQTDLLRWASFTGQDLALSLPRYQLDNTDNL